MRSGLESNSSSCCSNGAFTKSMFTWLWTCRSCLDCAFWGRALFVGPFHDAQDFVDLREEVGRRSVDNDTALQSSRQPKSSHRPGSGGAVWMAHAATFGACLP